MIWTDQIPLPDVPATWTQIPTALLRAELQRRQNGNDEKPACGTGRANSDYNMALHVFAVVLILVLSTLGMPAHVLP